MAEDKKKQNGSDLVDDGASCGAWKPANRPPEGTAGKWTRDVVVVTNFGDVFKLAYYHPSPHEDGGKWQRPARFNGGEEVEWWIEDPNN
jgi:hypothetical protein